MRALNGGDMNSYSNMAKEDKAKLNKPEVIKIKAPDKSKCGFKNPCVFGKHNPNFNNQLKA